MTTRWNGPRVYNRKNQRKWARSRFSAFGTLCAFTGSAHETSTTTQRCKRNQQMSAAKTTQFDMSCALSKGRPGVSPAATRMNVRFAPDFIFKLQIKNPMKIAPSIGQTPFADLMLHPEKLEAALKTAKSENDAFAASRTLGQSSTGHTRPNAPSQTANWPSTGNSTDTNS